MQRTLLNLIIDLASGFLFCALIATGYLLRFPLPPGTNKVLSLWGLSRHQWGEVHFWISTVLVSVLVVHVILHWQWLVTVIRQRLHRAKTNSSRAGWVIGLIAVGLFTLFAWSAHVSVRERSEPCCDDASTSNAKTFADDRFPKSSPPAVVSWADVFPILERSCVSCHGSKKAKGNFRIDRKDDYFTPRDGKALLVPGAPDQSPLIQIVDGTRTDIAFPERHRLPATDLAILRTWIAAGANFGP